MEEKKSYKADLERRRPMLFAVSILIVVVMFMIILFIPYKSIGQLAEKLLEDEPMDLDMQLKPHEDMIAAALPQQEKPKKEKVILNKVEEMPPEPAEIIQDYVPQEKNPKLEVVEEKDPVVNLNKDDDEVLRQVEELPEFPGGMVEYVKWLTKQLKYPQDALRAKRKGRVMVSFIVEKDGQLTNIQVAKASGVKSLDNEALRVMRLMPQWKPGKSNGKVCRTMMAVPVVFGL